MKNKFIRFGAMILPAVCSLIACGPTSNPTSNKGYDGKQYDISEKQDGSLIATSTKVEYNYTLTISGTGKAIDYSKKEQVPWNPIIKKIVDVSIEEGITHIGDYFFNSLPLEYFILPSTVNSVGDHTFNTSSTVYTYGGTLDNVKNVYYYSESRPSTQGNYFYMEDGEPHVWVVKDLSFLFIGNSFTFYTGSVEDPMVPRYFKAIAQNLGQTVNVDFVVKGSHTLTKFGNPQDEMGKIVEEKLTTKSYDYVILQEQSTTPINNYNTFLSAVTKLKARIDATQTNCTTVLYQKWGSPKGIEGTKYKTVRAMEEDLRTAYTNAGTETGCPVNYVGKAFTEAYETLPNINIYYDDNRHQSAFGTYLSAAVHVASIFDIRVSNTTEFCGLDESKCKALLSIADKI